MHKVIANLLSNAIKFTPNNGNIIIYVASIQKSGEEVLYIAIKDNGTGIANEDVDKIFNRFYQSRSHVKYPRITSYNVCYTKLLRFHSFESIVSSSEANACLSAFVLGFTISILIFSEEAPSGKRAHTLKRYSSPAFTPIPKKPSFSNPVRLWSCPG